MYKRKKTSWIKHIDFIIADIVCINITFLITFFFRVGIFNVYNNHSYRDVIIISMVLFFCIAFFSEFYSGILRRGYYEEAEKIILQNVILIVSLFTYMFIVQTGGEYSRIIFGSFFILNTLLMYLAHTVMKQIIRRRIKVSGSKKVLVIATSDVIDKSIRKLKNGHDNTFEIIGIGLVDGNDETPDKILGVPVVASGMDIYEYACRNVVDDVFVNINGATAKVVEGVADHFLRMGILVHLNMEILAQNLPNVGFGRMNSAGVMTTSINQVSTFDAFLKRLVDICAGVVGCIITGIIFIFAAPAIKIADPKGPVFFGQERIGKNGRVFKIYKFRSMYSDAEERKKELMERNKMSGLMFKIDDDPRIIGSGPDGKKKGLGHFLRASSLDEFPNFWSILKGDMSLVGTRPPTKDEYEKYELHHKSRLATKPGLTGVWQVSGRSNMTDFEEIVKLDGEYIKNWTFGMDIKIILKTILVVLKRSGSM